MYHCPCGYKWKKSGLWNNEWTWCVTMDRVSFPQSEAVNSLDLLHHQSGCRRLKRRACSSDRTVCGLIKKVLRSRKCGRCCSPLFMDRVQETSNSSSTPTSVPGLDNRPFNLDVVSDTSAYIKCQDLSLPWWWHSWGKWYTEQSLSW